MGYPDSLKALIKKVEETRPARVERKKAGEEFPARTLDERKEVLEKFHPDVNEEGRREIQVGPNKGYRICHEMVDLLEAKSRVEPDKVDLSNPDYETDVLVIGGGGAGTSAAILAAEPGARVIMATK
ncbi:FAD-binding protein, partial [bacterium]|nr:FAD-binding protein [bacterium]